MNRARWRIGPFSLRWQLILLILLALAPILGLLAYSTHEQQQQREAAVRNATTILAREIAAKHAQIFDRTRELLVTLSLMPAVRGFDAKQCSAVFAELLTRFPQYTNLVAANVDGDVFCSAWPVAQPVNIKREALFIRTLTQRGWAMGEFAIGKMTGRPFIGAGYPLLGARGEVVGAVGASLSVDWLNREAAKTALPAGSSFGIADAAGTLVIRMPDAEKWVGKNVADTAIFHARLRGEPYIEAAGMDGVTRVLGIAKIDSVPPPAEFYVSLGAHKDQAYQDVTERFWRNLLLLLGVAGVTLALAWRGTEASVLRPLSSLVAASERVAGGDYQARVEVADGATELQYLARSYNTMLAAIGASEQRFRETLANVHLLGVALDLQGNVTYCNDFLLEVSGWRREELLGRNWFENVLPNPAPVRAMFERAMREGSIPPHHENEIVTRAGEGHLIRWNNTLLRDVAGQLVGTVSLGENITERKRLEKYLREQLESLARSEAHGKHLLVLAERSRHALLNAIEDQHLAADALRQSESRFRAIIEVSPVPYALNDEQQNITYLNAAFVKTFGYDLGDIPALADWWPKAYPDPEYRRWAANTWQARLVQAKQSGTPFEPIEMSICCKDGMPRTALVAAAALGESFMGNHLVILYDITERKHAEDALRTYTSQLQEMASRLLEAQENERRNINRELHDRIGQNLSVLNLNLKLIRATLARDLPSALGARFDDTERLLEATTVQVRDVMAELHPPALDDYGLFAALRAHAASFGALTDTPLTLHGGDLETRLPPAVEMALFRIAQEALANVAKHAHAKGVDVRLEAGADTVTLTISDDGVGFDSARASKAQASWGLSVMRERAVAVGAALSIESAPGRGTRVRAEVAREPA